MVLEGGGGGGGGVVMFGDIQVTGMSYMLQ